MAIVQQAAYDEFVDFITSSPTLEQIADYTLSPEAQMRVDYLLSANRDGVMTPEERDELDAYLLAEHLMRAAKLRALEKLHSK
jgi:hypothetical protein